MSRRASTGQVLFPSLADQTQLALDGGERAIEAFSDLLASITLQFPDRNLAPLRFVELIEAAVKFFEKLNRKFRRGRVPDDLLRNP